MFTKRQDGFTFIELIVFIMIVSIAVVGILGVYSLTSAQSVDPMRRKQALMIAESLMEEVQMAQFTEFDPASVGAVTAPIPENWGQGPAEPGQGRPFDNVNDYVDTPGVPKAAFNNASGVLVNAVEGSFGAGYQATVAVTPAVLGGIGSAGTAPASPVLHIRITVTYDGDSIVLDGYRTRYAPN